MGSTGNDANFHCMEKMKRLLIYVYNEKSGIVGDATNHLLGEFGKIMDRIVVVCNGYLSVQGRRAFRKITEDVYCLNRRNLTEVAYADAIVNYCGIATVVTYDEVTLMDDSVWGPLCSLKKIYDEMGTRKCDYWKMAESVETSSYVVLRKSFLQRVSYQKYLEKLLAAYQKTFQGIGKKNIPETDKSPDSSYTGMTGDSYLKEKSEAYPFLEKRILEQSYGDILASGKSAEIGRAISGIRRNGFYNLELVFAEREMAKGILRNADLRQRVRDLGEGTIYIDYGSGYCECNAFRSRNMVEENGDFLIRFTIHEGYPYKQEAVAEIKGFRYDPLEQIPNLGMTLYRCKCDGREVCPKSHNGRDWGTDYQVFPSADPYYEFEYRADEIREIVIEGNMQFFNRRFVENMNSCRVTSYFSRIFWDEGRGYDEGHQIMKSLFLDGNGEFELLFLCELDHVRELRLDPIEDVKTRIKLSEIRINGANGAIKKTNGMKRGKNEWEFPHRDPIILFRTRTAQIRSVYVRGNIQFIE